VNKERLQDERHIGRIDIGMIRAAITILQNVMNAVSATRCERGCSTRSECEVLVYCTANLRRRTGRFQAEEMRANHYRRNDNTTAAARSDYPDGRSSS
jgi:hypothetical protein